MIAGMQYRLRTLTLALVIGPPAIGFAWWVLSVESVAIILIPMGLIGLGLGAAVGWFVNRFIDPR